jgi:hypothetical protein
MHTGHHSEEKNILKASTLKCEIDTKTFENMVPVIDRFWLLLIITKTTVGSLTEEQLTSLIL